MDNLVQPMLITVIIKPIRGLLNVLSWREQMFHLPFAVVNLGDRNDTIKIKYFVTVNH